METEKTNLPWELIIEIFARLPVKSLLRFKSVSKPCNSLITDPLFINKHFKQSTKLTSHSQKGIILSTTTIDHRHLISCPLSDLYNKPIEDVAKLNLVYPMKGVMRYINISDSINGLFCVEIVDDDSEGLIFLWNPCTRESKRLPNHKVEPPRDNWNSVRDDGMTYLLGFDSLKNDYKVLKLVRYVNERPNFLAYLYSLCTDSWRKIDESSCYKFSDYTEESRFYHLPYTELPVSSYKYVNGAIHWFGNEKDEVYSSKIFSLHMSTETFGEIPLPDCEVMDYPHNGLDISIAVLRGRLCVYRNRAERSFVLFSMKNYGDQRSWEKIIDIPYLIFCMYSRLYSSFVPLYHFESGDILMQASSSKGNTLVIYNRQKFGFLKVVARGLARIVVGHVFAESLISPTPTGVKYIQVDI